MTLFPDDTLPVWDRLVVGDYVEDLLHFFNLSHKECVKQFDNIPLPPSSALNNLLVEVFSLLPIQSKTVLTQLFMFPKPPFREVYYSDVIIDMCKSSKDIPPIVSTP